MSLIITAECINCGACEPECPNNAIYAGGESWAFSDGTTITGAVAYNGGMVEPNAKQPAFSDDLYFIVPEKCTECAGFFDEPQCINLCPVDCCVKDPEHEESQEELLAKKARLHPV